MYGPKRGGWSVCALFLLADNTKLVNDSMKGQFNVYTMEHFVEPILWSIDDNLL